MWALILGSLVLGSVLGMIYLVSRFMKFPIVRKAAGGKSFLRCCWGFWRWQGLSAAQELLSAQSMRRLWFCIWYLSGLCVTGHTGLRKKREGKKFGRYYAGIFALGITVVYLTCGWYLANHVWRTPYTVETEKAVGSLRIVQFADSHVGNTFSGEEFAGWVEDMQEENPDIVVITRGLCRR